MSAVKKMALIRSAYSHAAFFGFKSDGFDGGALVASIREWLGKNIKSEKITHQVLFQISQYLKVNMGAGTHRRTYGGNSHM